MSISNADVVVGVQLYSKLAEFLAPQGSLVGTPVVMLLEPCGKDVDPEDFRDIKNPNDPWKPIEAFSDLVNGVPIPGPTFIDSSRLYDMVYQLIVESAVTSGDPNDPVSTNAARQITSARFDIDNIVWAREDMPTVVYHPAIADPVQWWDPATPWSYASFTIGGTVTPSPTPPIIPLPPVGLPSLMWRSVPTEGYLSELATLIRPQGKLSLAKVRAQPPQSGIVARMEPLATARIKQPQSGIVAHMSTIATTAIERSTLQPEKTLVAPGTVATSVQALSARSAFEVLERQPAKLRYGELIHMARLLDTNAPQVATQPRDSGFSISFQYCVVSIKRPWLHRELFDMPGWWLPGFAAHAISNGQTTNNSGLLPAITTRFLAVRNLVVRAAWSDADRAKAEQAGKAAGVMALGPFTLTGDVHFDGTELIRPTPQIVAWMAAILPDR